MNAEYLCSYTLRCRSKRRGYCDRAPWHRTKPADRCRTCRRLRRRRQSGSCGRDQSCLDASTTGKPPQRRRSSPLRSQTHCESKAHQAVWGNIVQTSAPCRICHNRVFMAKSTIFARWESQRTSPMSACPASRSGWMDLKWATIFRYLLLAHIQVADPWAPHRFCG